MSNWLSSIGHMKSYLLLKCTLDEFKDVLKEVLSEQLRNAVEDEDRMNQKRAAEYLGISQTTIIKWKSEGKIPFEQVPGSSKVWFYKSELKKALRQH